MESDMNGDFGIRLPTNGDFHPIWVHLDFEASRSGLKFTLIAS